MSWEACPNSVSYLRLLRAVNYRSTSGKSCEEIHYMVELIDSLYTLSKEAQAQAAFEEEHRREDSAAAGE